MDRPMNRPWPDATPPTLDRPLPNRMGALVIHRDRYGPPVEALTLGEVPTPLLNPEDAGKVLVSVLATGPNFNTNFASLGLPVPVFGRGDAATVHVPGSDALGIVVAAGAGVRGLKLGQAVVLDAWTGSNIRGYESHDGFNAQFVRVDAERALPVPEELRGAFPEQLAGMLLTYGTAYRAVVERLAVRPGDSVLLMGGGKGTSFAGAQLVKALGGRAILMGSNPELARALIERGVADAFVDRRRIPAEVFGPVPAGMGVEEWTARTGPFRRAVFAANGGRPVDKVFEHTGGRNFPLLVSVLAEGGRLAFFGATGGGLKGEYQETFFYAGRRFVMDARWVWMRQKQVLFSRGSAEDILAGIRLPAGRRVLVWGADAYALDFVRAARARSCELAVVASRTAEADGIAELARLGVPDRAVLDRDRFELPADMPDPLTADGRPNPEYGSRYMGPARALGKAVWEVFGPRVSPDVVVERTDQSTLHFSTFLLRDFVETDDMPCGYVVARGPDDLSILGSHMYRSSQAREVLRLLARGTLVMEPGDVEVTRLAGLPELQQKMLEGRMRKPKGVALVQAGAPGRPIRDAEDGYLGEALVRPDPQAGRHIGVHLCDGVAILTLSREQALNALNQELLAQLAEIVAGVGRRRAIDGRPVRAIVLRGAGRAFVAGADVTEFRGSAAERIRDDRARQHPALLRDRDPQGPGGRAAGRLHARRRQRARHERAPPHRDRKRRHRPARGQAGDHPGLRRDAAAAAPGGAGPGRRDEHQRRADRAARGARDRAGRRVRPGRHGARGRFPGGAGVRRGPPQAPPPGLGRDRRAPAGAGAAAAETAGGRGPAGRRAPGPGRCGRSQGRAHLGRALRAQGARAGLPLGVRAGAEAGRPAVRRDRGLALGAGVDRAIHRQGPAAVAIPDASVKTGVSGRDPALRGVL